MMLNQLAADQARMENLLLGMLSQEQIVTIFGEAATRNQALNAAGAAPKAAAPKVKPLDNRRLDDPKPPKLAPPAKVDRRPLHEINRRELVANGAPVPQLHSETGGVSVLYAPTILDLEWGDLGVVPPATSAKRAQFDHLLREPK